MGVSVRQTLMGYYYIPTTADSPLNLVGNPEGNEERCRRVVWNNGNSRCDPHSEQTGVAHRMKRALTSKSDLDTVHRWH